MLSKLETNQGWSREVVYHKPRVKDKCLCQGVGESRENPGESGMKNKDSEVLNHSDEERNSAVD